MRWDRLFADLESQAKALEQEDRDYLVEELVDEMWSGLSWHELLGGSVELEVAHHGLMAGEVVVANGRIVQLETSRATWVLSAGAVLGIVSTERRAAPLTPVTSTLSWSRVWRSMRETGQDVSITRTDGSPVVGRVENAGGDFVVIQRGETHTVVPNLAVSTLSCGRY